MFKSLLLTIVFLFLGLFVSAGDPPTKQISVINKWTQVVQYDDNNYNTKTQDLSVTVYPSFIVMKTVEDIKNGYLVKVWVSSFTHQNGEFKNIKLSDVSVSFFNGKYWQNNLIIKFIVVSNVPTLVNYFFTNNPNVMVSFKWTTAKINN